MTSPKHAHDTGDTGRYYTHPETGKRLVSVTNVLGTAVNKPALVPWAAKITAEKTVDLIPQLTAAALLPECGSRRVADECGQCTPCLVKTAKREVTVVKEKAGDLGNRIHAHAEAHVTGQQLPDDDEVSPYLGQYLRFLDDYSIDLTKDIEAAELTVADPHAGYAGTLDLIVRMPLDGFIPGHAVHQVKDGAKRGMFIVDLKTSATRPTASVYAEYALQLAALRSAKEMWLPDDTIQPMLRGITGAAVLNLRAKDYAFIPVPTGDAETAAFRGALAATKWLHGTGNDINRGEYRPVLPSGRAKPKRATKKTTSKTPGKAA